MEELTAVQDVPSIEETARLFVRNLPYSTTEADLAEAFREHGEVSEAHLVLDRWPRALMTAACTPLLWPMHVKRKEVSMLEARPDDLPTRGTLGEDQGPSHRCEGWQALQDHQEEQGHRPDPVCRC